MRSVSAAKLLFVLICLFLAGAAQSTRAEPRQQITNYQEKMRQANDIAVTIVVSGLTCTCARFAEDIRNVVNDLRPEGVRVLPVLGVGGLQNLNDVLFLKNVDMGVIDEDNLQMLKKRDPQLYANIEQRVQYITKLYNSEFQVLARNEIKTIGDLRGKKVNFNLKDSQTEVTADAVFNKLQIDTVRSNYDNDLAIRKVIGGELAAMIVLTGAPQTALAKLKPEDGVHFLAFDEDTMPGSAGKQILNDYIPTELTHEQYPALIPQGVSVPTFANRAMLIAYAWPEGSSRYNKIAKFVREFFGKMDQFHDQARHPKWKEVNIATEMPGWTRFKPAAQWIAEHRVAAISKTPGAEDSAKLKLAFDQFLNQYVASKGLRSIPESEREALFAKFIQSMQFQSAINSPRQ
jgi:TRAP-type uncharacterized transport system substrate-binding protein